MKTINKKTYSSAQKITYGINITLVILLCFGTQYWVVRKIGPGANAQTWGEVIIIFLLFMGFWLGGCTFGMVLNSYKKTDQE